MNKVVDTIKIEKIEGGAFNVVQGDRYADGINYDEMLGLVSALTMPPSPGCLMYMGTKEEHESWRISMACVPSEVEFEDVLVPEGISIYMVHPPIIKSDYGDGLFIKFGDNQFLGVYEGTWIVCSPIDTYKFIEPIQCKIIPCNRGDLSAGDTAIYCAELSLGKICLPNYCKILNDKEFVAVNEAGTTVGSSTCWDWYKVVTL